MSTTADTVITYATAASAVATAVTAIVIAFQARATRQSVAVSQTMVTEAAQARLDDTAPHVTVATSIFNSWRKERTGYFEGTSVDHLAEISHTRDYSLPDDGLWVVWIQIQTDVGNTGPERARLRLENVDLGSSLPSVRVEIGKDSQGSLQISPGGSILSLKLAVGQTVKDWATQPKLNAIVANLRVDDERDNGVIDTWPLHITADGLVLSENGKLKWPTYPAVRTLPRRRTYFRSKVDDVPLVPPRQGRGRTPGNG